jgi:OmpA-OmpF porin, OOP family
LLRLKHWLLLSSLFLIVAPGVLLGQAGVSTTLTRDDQLLLAAPSVSGQTGLFETVTADTLRRGDVSFGVYWNDWDLLAGPARDFAPLSARGYHDMGYDKYQLSGSLGYGLSDRWEVSAMVPWVRLVQNGADRAGFVNGWLYQGRFTDSGLGDVRLATKFGLLPPGSATRFALSIFTDLPTGDDKSGISTGAGSFGVGAHWTHGIGTFSASYKIAGDRTGSRSNFPGGGSVQIPNEFRVDAGLNIPQGWWTGTNWISELNAIGYNGGDRNPKSPVFLMTGLRHWFGNSGWALSAGARWNVSKFTYDHEDCRVTELDDCGLSGLVGLTFAPMHLAAAVPPAPPAPTPTPVTPTPPPPTTTPVPPPPPPVAPPHQPQTLRTDEIHFEPGSARLTNIAKAILDDIALRMKQEPTSTALVIGYTDDRENTGANADLDRRRAEAVRDYLVSRHGIDASRISVEGRDAREPVADNSTAEGRLRNRRVVIRLILP